MSGARLRDLRDAMTQDGYAMLIAVDREYAERTFGTMPWQLAAHDALTEMPERRPRG